MGELTWVMPRRRVERFGVHGSGVGVVNEYIIGIFVPGA